MRVQLFPHQPWRNGSTLRAAQYVSITRVWPIVTSARFSLFYVGVVKFTQRLTTRIEVTFSSACYAKSIDHELTL
jgi:hypothetical protein